MRESKRAALWPPTEYCLIRAPTAFLLVLVACRQTDGRSGGTSVPESTFAWTTPRPAYWPMEIPRVTRLGAGEFVWSAGEEPAGPALIVVSLPEQMAYVYHGGREIGRSRVETGDPGHRTPTGTFQLLGRKRYRAAGIVGTGHGIALTGSARLGGPTPATVRIPPGFAILLEPWASAGGVIVIIDDRHAAANVTELDFRPPPAEADSADPVPAAPWWFRPERSEQGPIAIVVSSASREMRVLRNGIEIARAPIQLIGAAPLTETVLVCTDRSIEPGTGPANREGPRLWTVVGRRGLDSAVAFELRSRVRIPMQLGSRVFGLVETGTVIVLTPEELPAWPVHPPRLSVLTSGAGERPD